MKLENLEGTEIEPKTFVVSANHCETLQPLYEVTLCKYYSTIYSQALLLFCSHQTISQISPY